MKANNKIDIAINKLVSLLGNTEGRYTEQEKRDIAEAIALLQKYKDTRDKEMLQQFVISLLRAFLIQKIFFGENDNQH